MWERPLPSNRSWQRNQSAQLQLICAALYLTGVALCVVGSLIMSCFSVSSPVPCPAVLDILAPTLDLPALFGFSSLRL